MSTESAITEKQNLSSNWSRWIPRALEVIVGGVLLLAGFIKASDPLGFDQQIAAYKIVTAAGAVKALAWIFIAVEIILGAALLAGFKRRIVVPAAMVLIVLFIGVLGWAWYTGATADCGCFGAWVKRTPQQALIEDLLILAGISAAWILNRQEIISYQRLRLAVVVIATIAGLGVTAVASRRPDQASDPVARLQAGQQQGGLFDSIKISDSPIDIRKGLCMVALIDTGCDHCQASVPTLNQYFDNQAGLLPFAAICPNKPEEIKQFQKKFSAKFPIGRISDGDFTKLVERGTTPRVFLLRDGAIEKIWDGDVPPEAEVKSVIEKHS